VKSLLDGREFCDKRRNARGRKRDEDITTISDKGTQV
jgi:hypothetical protein